MASSEHRFSDRLNPPGASGAATARARRPEAAGSRTGDPIASAGGQMKSLAGLLRQNPVSHELLGPASSALAERLEAGGDYLETRGLGGVAEDAVACMRRRPVETLLFGVGLALIVSRTARLVRR